MINVFRRINKQIFYRVIIFSGFALFFLISTLTGRSKLFVNPKLNFLLVFCALFFVIVAASLLPYVLKPVRKSGIKLSYLIFALPLLMAFVIPAKTLGSNYASMYNINGNPKVGNAQNDTSYGTDTKEDSRESPDTANPGSNNGDSGNSANGSPGYSDGSGNESADIKLTLTDNRIIFNDNNFIRWLEELYTNTKKYEGLEVEITGFVFKDKQFKNDEFVAARSIMVCCAADLQVAGLMCRYQDTNNLNKDSWVKVKGKIKKDTVNGEIQPFVVVDSIENTTKPANEYVYPF